MSMMPAAMQQFISKVFQTGRDGLLANVHGSSNFHLQTSMMATDQPKSAAFLYKMRNSTANTGPSNFNIHLHCSNSMVRQQHLTNVHSGCSKGQHTAVTHLQPKAARWALHLQCSMKPSNADNVHASDYHPNKAHGNDGKFKRRQTTSLANKRNSSEECNF
ncbi:hypothetical protein ACLOJK_014846 [Asimina triloba]